MVNIYTIGPNGYLLYSNIENEQKHMAQAQLVVNVTLNVRACTFTYI